MHDMNEVRANPARFDELLARRYHKPAAGLLIEVDDIRKAKVTALDAARSAAKARAAEVGALFKAGKREEAEAAREAAREAEASADIPSLEFKAEHAQFAVQAALERLPNLPADDVPLGLSEDDNEEVSRSAGARGLISAGPQHFEIGERLGLMDFERAAAMSGSRFVVLKGDMARLQRALGQFMLDMHTRRHGYTEVDVPLIVETHALYGTGQLPKFEDDLFKIDDNNRERYLIPTAEVSLTNLVAGAILSEAELPQRYTALTPCFRSEAGSAGRDTRGMLRQHQFMKCELVSIVRPEDSEAEHERMLEHSTKVLEALGLPYRVVKLCTGDMGFSAQKTYDIEVWMPGQQAYREIASISNCGAFQARRMNARYRPNGGKPVHLHTLNGSGVAVGRAMIAVLENCVDEDGGIALPSVLWPFFGSAYIEPPEKARA